MFTNFPGITPRRQLFRRTYTKISNGKVTKHFVGEPADYVNERLNEITSSKSAVAMENPPHTRDFSTSTSQCPVFQMSKAPEISSPDLDANLAATPEAPNDSSPDAALVNAAHPTPSTKVAVLLEFAHQQSCVEEIPAVHPSAPAKRSRKSTKVMPDFQQIARQEAGGKTRRECYQIYHAAHHGENIYGQAAFYDLVRRHNGDRPNSARRS